MLEARRRREEQLEASATEGGALSPQLLELEEPRADLKTNSAQIQQLVGAGMAAALLIGMWCTWSDVVPALGFLDRFTLWSTTVTVTEQVNSVAGETALVPTEKIRTVTLADAGLAALVAIITFVAAKNAPGLVELSVLRRLPLDNSVCYALRPWPATPSF